MLAAHCPSCGSPAPVSLATPDWISCPSCRYGGTPSAEVSEQLRDAAGALWAMDDGDRQLSNAQRYNLRAARSSLFVLIVVLLLVLLPLFGIAAGCSLVAASGEGFEPMTLVLFLGGCLPLALGLGAAILALRHVRNRGRALAERCAALPPATAGEPARCHVCGGSLTVESKQGVVRCAFCRADNLVSDAVLARMARERRLEVGKIGQQVRFQARALDQSALAAGALALGVAVLSPFAAVIFVFVVAILGSTIQMEPRDDATYALVQVTNSTCVAEVRSDLDFRETSVGFEKRPLPPAGVTPKKSNEFVGMELAYDEGQRGRVTRIFRDAISPSIDRVELQVADGTRTAKLTSRCQLPKVRRTVGTDPRFRDATELRLVGNQLWVQKGMELIRLPKSGGAVEAMLTAPRAILAFEPTPNGVVLLLAATAPAPKTIERWQGTEHEQLGEGDALALDGEDLLVGHAKGLRRREPDGKLTELATTTYVSLIDVTPEAIYWFSGADLYERDRASGNTRKIGHAYDVTSFTVVGNFVAMVNGSLYPSFLPLAGGTTESVTGGSFSNGRVQRDGNVAYFGLQSSGSRGGVAGLVLGKRSATSDRHYGIDTGLAQAFTIGSGEVFWVSDNTIYAEPIVPQ